MTVAKIAAGGTSVIFLLPEAGLPLVLHWGADPGALTAPQLSELHTATVRGVSSSALDQPWPLTVLPTESDGWAGRPGLVLQRESSTVFPVWREPTTTVRDASLESRFVSDGLEFRYSAVIDTAGLVHINQSITNHGTEPLSVHSLEATLPVGGLATEVLDFTGRWTRERTPQRSPLTQGSTVRESRRGRTGHDSPFLLAVGTQGFDDQTGQIWATHLAWSGDSIYRRDILPESVPVIGVGELLRPGEIVLADGQVYEAPEAVFAWSDGGLDALSARFHRSLRARPGHPRTPRPVILNTWEAVYFNHDQQRLLELADTAAGIGVERFVLDDGWFHRRRSDTAGLGDWFVDSEVWPDGLHPLVDRVRVNGMQFGLWVEPEMISLDSDLARQHPEWILGPDIHLPRAWRNQQVLNLAIPEAWNTIFEHLSSLIDEYDIDYLKWDQNRDLHEAAPGGRAGVHAHTTALYRLLDGLRARYPALEIESCASGGARVDLGILARTDRVWASDSNDPHERLAIQRWTELLLPPELIGSHVGLARAHTTGRHTDLGFRMAATLFASPGLEMNIAECTPEERIDLARWIAFYKEHRQLIHSGDLRHGSTGDSGTELTGVIDEAKRSALYRYARTSTSRSAAPGRLLLTGLAPHAHYRVSIVDALPLPTMRDSSPPLWLQRGEASGTGLTLAAVGLAAPLLDPDQALVLRVEATC
ncbi:alpha-galactosidase [Agreia bicolorata]|uniref:alpha-galactosidase n=1 Tax=Agreia bicolorata TaxID=110935 RepID=A0ABR5CHG9_9MICO|nr:alpha-galactosidase [Agreia bicolorata]KJC65016.1 alpha-galactosidase [Agreia bicolorata]